MHLRLKSVSCEVYAMPGGFRNHRTHQTHGIGGCAAGLPVCFRELREAHDRTTARWPTAPWMLARASAKRMHCQVGFNTTNTRRCVALFVTLGLRPRKSNASAKHMRCQDFTANYARRTTAPRRDGLRPRGCWLVLLRSVCTARRG